MVSAFSRGQVTPADKRCITYFLIHPASPPEMALLTESDLIFSEQANHHFSKTLNELKRTTLSIHNRLQSIQTDAAFAERVAAAYGRPLIANERCGSWYVDPQVKGGSAYFKSTDGHAGVWTLSSRRLNLHLLEIIGDHDGCVIVDSTRRGKSKTSSYQTLQQLTRKGMPDALSKTIPIWCNVINRLLFPHTTNHPLFTPPQVVSKSEHAQIAALLPSFLQSLQALDISIDDFKKNIAKPLRPIWVTPDSHLTPTEEIFQDFHPVICCTVSRRVQGGELSEGGYIQGAGDDTENWAYNLTPSVFWSNYETLLSTSEADLPGLIQLMVQAHIPLKENNAWRCVKPTSYLFIAPISAIEGKGLDPQSASICLESKVSNARPRVPSSTQLIIGLGPRKTGSRNLRAALPDIVDFARSYLIKQISNESPQEGRCLIVACETGKDLSVGAALAILCLLFNNTGKLQLGNDKNKEMKIDKNLIRKKLSWISTSMPDANPSRATLQSVNSFLIERPR
ncbi:hypothetical protein B7494_g8621 [Chlorociboria aeruginascens]|nr:hypothetical protein B7494_g8621 [Chlorociboria aeruginascens]